MLSFFSGTLLPHKKDSTQKCPTMGEIGLNNFAPYLMNRLMAHWNTSMLEELKAHGITTMKMRTLAVLSVIPSLTINELADFALAEQSTMSRTLDALEDQGYIRRQPRADDMRIRDVCLTQAGRDALNAIWPTVYNQFVSMFDGIEEAEYRSFVTTLHKVGHNLAKSQVLPPAEQNNGR